MIFTQFRLALMNAQNYWINLHHHSGWAACNYPLKLQENHAHSPKILQKKNYPERETQWPIAARVTAIYNIFHYLIPRSEIPRGERIHERLSWPSGTGTNKRWTLRGHSLLNNKSGVRGPYRAARVNKTAFSALDKNALLFFASGPCLFAGLVVFGEWG